MRISLAVGLIVVGTLALRAFAAEPEVVYTGIVVDSSGRPVEGAKVSLYEWRVKSQEDTGESSTVDEVKTAADGIFSLCPKSQLKPADRSTIVASRDGFSLGFLDPLMLSDGSRETPKITLQAPCETRGTVVDETGKPVAGAEVVPYLYKRGIAAPPPLGVLGTKTDAEGAFKFDNLPPEWKTDFLVSAQGRESLCTYRADRTVRGQYATGSTGIRIVVPPEAVIEGKVLQKTGEPVAGVTLYAKVERWIASNLWYTAQAVTAEDGSFRLCGLSRATYVVRFVTPREGVCEWAAAPVEIQTENGKIVSGVMIQAEKGGVLEVHVTDAQTGRAIGGADFWLSSEPSDNHRRYLTTGADGTYQTRLPAGEYAISDVQERRYFGMESGQKAELTISQGERTHKDFPLKPRPRITGTVLDDTGAPLAGVSLRTAPYAGSFDRSQADGSFEVLRRSPYTPDDTSCPLLFARHAERGLAAAFQTTQTDAPVEIRLRPGIKLTGRVTDPSAKPLADAAVSLGVFYNNAAAWMDIRTVTDATGVYAFYAIPAGVEYQIEAGADGYGPASTNIAIQPDKDAECRVADIAVPLADRSITGTVVGPDGKGVERVRVYATQLGKRLSVVFTDKEGKFRLDGLIDGPANLDARTLEAPWMNGSARNVQTGNDKTIVVSEEGGRIEAQRPKEPPPLAGKPLPDLTALSADFDVAPAEGKVVLVAFFDSNQRPSRHLLGEFVKAAQSLEEKGVSLFGVDLARDISPEQTTERLPFPSARVHDDEALRVVWGVRGLPWLVLADKGRTVKAEGFPLDELDARLAALGRQ